MNKWYTVKALKGGAAEITMFGDVGYGYTASDWFSDVKSLGDVKTIDLRINSHGGDVFQGFAIYNMIKRMKATVRVTIEGLAASMASVIAMAGDEIIMPANAHLMIHNPVGSFEGGVEPFKNFSKALEKMQDDIVQAYVDRSGLDEDLVKEMMAKETWLSAQKAVSLGFADKIEEPIQIAASAYALGRFRNVPKAFGTIKENNTMSDRKEVNAQIKRVCALAGKPDLAATFITDDKSVEEVMAALETAKATDDATARATEKAVADAKAKAEKDGSKEKQPVDETAIRAQVLAEHQEVKALCALAGFPDKADGFITARKSVADVMSALAEAKAAKDKDPKGKAKAEEVSGRHNARPGEENAKTIDTNAIYNRFNKVKAA